MASRRFINIKNFKVGVTAHDSIQSVSWTESVAEIAASGDADKVDTFLAKGKSECRGTIALQDPIQAEALKDGAKADVTFEGEPEEGGTATKVTIKNVIFFGSTQNAVHNAVWTQSLPFRAYDPTGGNLVTFADVVAP